MPTAKDEQGIVSLRYGLFSWFDAGVGYAFNARKIIWNARIQPGKKKKTAGAPVLFWAQGASEPGTVTSHST